MLETIGLIVQLVGVPLALIGLWLSSRSAARSQDLQVILSFVESFREKWEGSWADLLDRIEALPDERSHTFGSDKDERELTYMLNWIDWIGNLAKSGFLRQEEVILTSISHALQRAITMGEPIIAKGIADFGDGYWAGIAFVKDRLQIKS